MQPVHSPKPTESFAEAVVELEPGQDRQVQLELFRIRRRPKFKITCKPDIGEALEWRETKLTDGRVYYPVYEFRNASNKHITVTIWWVGGGKGVRSARR